MAWLWRVEFGAVAVCFCAVLVRLMVRELGAVLRGCNAEDWLLLAGSVATAARVAIAPWAGPVETGWVWGFAVVCAAYLAAKRFRAAQVEN